MATRGAIFAIIPQQNVGFTQFIGGKYCSSVLVNSEMPALVCACDSVQRSDVCTLGGLDKWKSFAGIHFIPYIYICSRTDQQFIAHFPLMYSVHCEVKPWLSQAGKEL